MNPTTRSRCLRDGRFTLRSATKLDQLKSEFSKNRGKSLVLGVLTLALAFFGVRMVWDTSPRAATASVENRLTPRADGTSADPARSLEMEQKMREGAALWTVLREKRGLDASLAFNFESQYYTLDPARRIVAAEPERVEAVSNKNDGQMAKDDARSRLDKAEAEAKRLNIRAVMLGDDPAALINSELVHVGGRILGFTVKSIQERQVLLEKDGVVFKVDMAK